MLMCRFTWWPWRRTESKGLNYLVVMMIAAVLSSLSQQHASLLLRQIMGHLCLNSTTGAAWAFLIHLLITPSGHEKNQSQERRSDQCCPTGDLLSGWHLDIRRLLSSHRRDKKKPKDTWEALLQLRALKRLCRACYPPVVITFCMRLSSLGSFLTRRKQEASGVRRLVTTLSPLLGWGLFSCVSRS